ncbi:carboxypeptidase regulatory-like domain-containing protein [Fibrisoma montanum]|uniref:Carboxypeptidase regulatory-like domain-containing protein n=1 Tax=Fibrisoma montanum TaxID=2305895 RepID=A0A418MIN7_9BACT|nr:carboxypeptidase-like regulatory domain-containing protein [Fibrisoma montanum]RIV27318.1 carboxypeptidase regulatory-like domain-containing protein [Fibrisoma montanum]
MDRFFTDFFKLIICLSGLLLASSATFGQTTDATITGVIKGNNGEVLPGATITARNESTGFQTGTVSNIEGRYTMRQVPLGGPYTITVSYVGFTNQARTGYRLNQADQLVVDFNLAESGTELQEVKVTENALKSRIDRIGASTAITASNIAKLPINNRSFTNLLALSPLSNGGSIGGQLPSSTNYLIDGASARNNLTSGALGNGPFSLSLEAIREFEIVANEYDVTKGRQGGGTVSVVTKSGTNTTTGTAFTYYNADGLSSARDIRGNSRAINFTRFQYGFSLGGPIIKDKLHYFVALDRQTESSPFYIADIRTDADANALGISRAVLDSVITIGRQKYGLSNTQQVGEFNRETVANTLFTRLDWQINDKNVLTIRNNFSNWNNPNSVEDNSQINLYETYSSFSSRENSTLVSLRSTFRPTLINELKVQYQSATRNYEANTLLPSANIPRAIVTVRSILPNGLSSNRSVQLGGQRFTPERNLENQIQLANTVYWNKGRYNFTFGTDNTLTYLDTYISNEQNGRFIFNSLREFDQLNPSRYAREVPINGIPSVQQYVLNASLFGQVQFNPHPDVAVQAGLRWDLTSYLTKGDYNPVVDRELGLRTDANPTDWNNIQPRFRLTWNPGGRNRDIFRVGGGVFSAYVINYAQVNNIQNSGTKVAAIDVTRPANASQPNLVPRPDFVAYRNDPNTAPGVPAGAPTVSTINLNDPNFQVPTIYKVNATYSRFFGNNVRLGANLLYTRTLNNYVYIDQNLVDEPYFTLSNEANRGVFVPANSIAINSGQTNNVLGRKTQAVGRTLMLTNGAKLQTLTFILDGEIRLPRNGSLAFSYTWNDARDNTSYNGNVANTSTFRPIKSDPRSLSEINYSDNQFRHKLVAFGSTPAVGGVVLSVRFTGLGGTRYSLLVDGDINGDFVGGPGNDNDLAFVFDPNNPEVAQTVRTSMQRVLSNPDNRAADYIRSSIGTISDRNGGENPFSGTFDVRLSKVFKTIKTQRLEVSVDVFNFANFLGQALDGVITKGAEATSKRNWGGNYNLGNQTLLIPTGFNPTTRQYVYRVNENVGITQKNGTPYTVQLGARYSF